jgi:phage shock protein C
MRSRSDRKLFGVCGGLAAYLGLDPTLVRVGVVLGSVVFGPLILIYLGLAFAIPKEPKS